MEHTRVREPASPAALEELARDDSSRKRFLKMAGGSAVAAGLSAALAACGSSTKSTAKAPALGPLGLLPLPSKWVVEFGEPISLDEYDEDAWQDAMLVFNLTDRIRDSIQQMLYRNLMSRRSVFF